jgi:holliday junction DNA helicase RuvA
MIATLRGSLLEKTDEGAIVEVSGVGYAVQLSSGGRDRLPAFGEGVFLYVEESVAMYGGGVTLYGFFSSEERKIFRALKDNVPGTGAKKAMEWLDKASKSLPDFRRALLEKDAKCLVTVFGFTSKMAEKVVSGLHGKVDALPLSAGTSSPRSPASQALEEAIQGLVALGYRDSSAREAAQAARDLQGSTANPQSLIKDALRRLSGRS